MTPDTPNVHHVQVRPLSSSLLLDEEPLYVVPKLALTVQSTNGAMLTTKLSFLQGIHMDRKDAVIHDERVWVPLSYQDWIHEIEGVLSESSIRRALAKLEKNNFILTGTFRRGSGNRTKHYAVNSDLLRELYAKNFLPPGLTLDRNTDPFNPSENARLVFPTLVKALGSINRVLVLQQLHFKLHLVSKSRDPEVRANNYRDGRYWYWHSISQWQENNFPFLSEDAVKASFLYLRELGVVLAEKYNTADGDTTNWYSIDRERLEEVLHAHAEGHMIMPEPANPMPIGSVHIPPTGSVHIPPTGSVHIPPTHEHGISDSPNALGSVHIPPPSSVHIPPPYIRASKEPNKESSSSQPRNKPTEPTPTAQTTTTSSSDPKTLHPLITQTLHHGFLKELFDENPTREHNWSALTDEDIHNVKHLMQTDTSQTQYGSKLIRALDTVATKRAASRNDAINELTTRARERRNKSALDAQQRVYEDYAHLDYEELTARATKAWREVQGLPLENFMEPTQPQ